jgi:hypothetical protein
MKLFFEEFFKNIFSKVVTKASEGGSCYLVCTHAPLENKKSAMEKNFDPKIHKGVEVEPCTHDKPPKNHKIGHKINHKQPRKK